MKPGLIVGVLAVVGLSLSMARAEETSKPEDTKTQPAAAAAKTAPAAAAETPPAESGPAGSFRIWKSAGGAEIEAEFVEIRQGFVALKGKDGNLVRIRQSQLSREDQAWIAAQGAESGAAVGTGSVTSPTAPHVLPTFGDGKWKGFHAVYEDPSFDAVMDGSGAIRVHPKVNGKRTGKSLSYSLSCYFIDTSRTPPQHTGRPVMEYHEPPVPQMQPKEIALKGLLRDSVPFEVAFEFKGNKISSYGWLKDPKGLRDATVFRTGVSVPASHEIPPDMKVSEQIELLKGYEVRVRPVEGKSTVHPYHQPMKGGEFSIRSKEVQIVGPVFGDRQIRVMAQSTDKAPIRPWIYPGYAPWQGYFIGLYKDEPDSRATSQRMVLIID